MAQGHNNSLELFDSFAYSKKDPKQTNEKEEKGWTQ